MKAIGSQLPRAALVCAAAAFLFNGALGQRATAPPYKDPKLPVEKRVADLLARMSVEEKVAQTLAIWKGKALIMDDAGHFAPAKAKAVLKNGLGQVTRPSEKKGPREMAEFTNAIQKWVIENTRLGIPVMFHEECLHGHAAPKGTSFPQAIAMAGTWDPALVERIFSAIAVEVRARGAQQALTPVLDLARDPRWGRVEETYGEDPWLVSRIGLAAIRGFQGPGPTIDHRHIWATAKHFAAHGQPEGGTNIAPANYSERLLRSDFLFPFEMAVRQGHVGAVMASYNEIDAVPSHANRWLLGQVLRKEWGFQGFIVSDYNAITELETIHHVAASPEQAAAIALEAGVDLELPDMDRYLKLADQVKKDPALMPSLDRAVSVILRSKFLAGLFETPYADPAEAERVTNSPEHRKLALEAAEKSIVLLKNDASVLPLDNSRIGTLAVIGPNADKVLLGGYSDDPGYFVTVLDGIRQHAGDKMKVVHAEGCRITEPGGSWNTDEVKLPDPQQDAARVEEAIRVAQTADAVVLMLGGNEEVSREAWASNHLGDMDTLELPGRQNELARRIAALGKPVVAVLLNGRPYAITELASTVPGILEGWYLGQETGHAVAAALFGDVNPGAKLPVSFARNVGQLPIFYNMKPSAKRGYLFADSSPLFPFGHGLSYTTFKYSNLRVAQPKIAPDGKTTLSVDVANTGNRAGDEVVQLYIRDDVSSVTRPVKELRGFERVSIAPGEKRTVTFPISSEHLQMWNLQMKRVVEPGTFTLMVGGSSQTVLETKLEVTAK